MKLSFLGRNFGMGEIARVRRHDKFGSCRLEAQVECRQSRELLTGEALRRTAH